MDTKELIIEIRKHDSDIARDSDLVKSLQEQIDKKVKNRDALRIELKVAFLKKNDLKQPSAKHVDIYTE